jgi:hypothetical protein
MIFIDFTIKNQFIYAEFPLRQRRPGGETGDTANLTPRLQLGLPSAFGDYWYFIKFWVQKYYKPQVLQLSYSTDKLQA